MEGDVLNTVAKLSLYFTVGGGILPHHRSQQSKEPRNVKERDGASTIRVIQAVV